MEVLNDGLEEDVLVALLLIEALHDEAERLTRTAVCGAKPQDGVPGLARYLAWGVRA